MDVLRLHLSAVPSKPGCYCVHVNAPVSDPNNQLELVRHRSAYGPPVQTQEAACRYPRGTLVSVNKGVALDQAPKQGRCLAYEVGVFVVPGVEWASESRFKTVSALEIVIGLFVGDA